MILFSGEREFIFGKGREITFVGKVEYSKRFNEISFTGKFFELEEPDDNGDPVLTEIELGIDGNQLAGYLELSLD